MKLNFGPKGMLMIDDARIIFRNFAGEGSMYNREGDRNFALVIPTEEQADALVAEGWNVKVKDPVEEGDTPRMHLPVKVKFNDRGPKIILNSGGKPVELTEATVSCLDKLDIASVNMDIRPFDWGPINGKCGRSAYLQALEVFQNIDRFSAKYAEEDRFRD